MMALVIVTGTMDALLAVGVAGVMIAVRDRIKADRKVKSINDQV